MAIAEARIRGVFPGVVASYEEIRNQVVVGGVDVVAGTHGSVYLLQNRLVKSLLRKPQYIAVVEADLLANYTFSEYRDTSFRDWKSVLEGGAGEDSPAYMIAGYTPGPEMSSNRDFQRRKDLTYVSFHFRRTEDIDSEGVFSPASSCIVSTAWDWNAGDYFDNQGGGGPHFSNRWGRPFQAYRYQRKSINQYEWGQTQKVITSRNKVRGHGNVFSFKLESEPGKDCQVLGWSLVMGANGNV